MTYTINDIKKSHYCTKISKKIIVVEENEKKLIIKNPEDKNIYKCKVDNGLIKSEKYKKCDFITIIDDKEREKLFFIELKGRKYDIAFKQILSTDSMIDSNNNKNLKKEAFVITSRTPKATADYTRAIIKMKKCFEAKSIKLHPLKNMRGEVTV